ncbi:hypothetical protein TKK_0017622 [Trichogramma kaykai]
MAELVKSRGSSYHLSLEGFLYYENGGTIGKRAYWLCKMTSQCCARAVTIGGPDDLQLVKGAASDHICIPDVDAVEAIKVVSGIKIKAEAHPEAPPAQVLSLKIYLPVSYSISLKESICAKNKEESSYRKVFEVITQLARENGIRARRPATVMSDFELAIINAGLQVLYVSKEDSSIRDATHHLMGLAFVPPQDVKKLSRILAQKIPRDFKTIYKYFEKTYQKVQTNNVSEGWHNRLRVVMGRDHPSFYVFLTEIKKKQAGTEILLRQLQLGQKVWKGQDPQRKKKEEKLFSLVSQYYVEHDDVMSYLKNISTIIRL